MNFKPVKILRINEDKRPKIKILDFLLEILYTIESRLTVK